jgi:dephospho-CoA kinase
MGGGKSTVAHLLRQMGFDVLDADDVARKVLSPGSQGEAEVFRTFGRDLADKQGRLDRRALGRMVFAQPEKLQILEGIIHPLVRTEIAALKAKLSARGASSAFYDVPLLYEKNMQTDFDYVVVVTASKQLRQNRVVTRSQLTVEEIEERNLRHLPAEIKEQKADALVRNEGSLEDLKLEVIKALKKLKIALPSPA